ncbi:MAG: GNAT family N-acetyltransferase [Planctomycetes bacterium]|nr:GNAT family N-acetyltransferase [Planctomycetota bacterium]
MAAPADRPRLSDDALVLRRANLDGLSPPRPAPPYALRQFRPGDEEPWRALLDTCFPDAGWTLHRLHEVFLDPPLWNPERVVFACRSEAPVACCAAWHEPWCSPETGMIHWVAVHPDHLRRGLGASVVAESIESMRPLGYRDAALITQVWRVPAIRLYQRLGFAPDMQAADDMPCRWAQAEANLRAAGVL